MKNVDTPDFQRLLLPKVICVFAFVMALLAFAGCASVSKDVDFSKGRVASTKLVSNKTGAEYPIYIYLPSSYSSSSALFPVIYATDGDAAFPPSGRFVNFVRILQRRNVD